MSTKIDDSGLRTAKARGERVKELREALGYKRRIQFAEKHGLKENTLQGWETARLYGINEKAAETLSQAFQEEGVDCRPEWILYGIGPSPLGNIEGQQPRPTNLKKLLREELLTFQRSHPNSLDTIINDDGLAPYFLKGDHVAGVRYFSDDLDRYVGLPCIIQLESGDTTTRLLAKHENGEFYCQCANHDADKKHAGNIFSAAPIIWMRRHINYNKKAIK